MNTELPILYRKKDECCGCGACSEVCPKNSIKMIRDEEGFDYPKIDEKTCIRCYRCIKVCPWKMKF